MSQIPAAFSLPFLLVYFRITFDEFRVPERMFNGQVNTQLSLPINEGTQSQTCYGLSLPVHSLLLPVPPSSVLTKPLADKADNGSKAKVNSPAELLMLININKQLFRLQIW